MLNKAQKGQNPIMQIKTMRCQLSPVPVGITESTVLVVLAKLWGNKSCPVLSARKTNWALHTFSRGS